MSIKRYWVTDKQYNSHMHEDGEFVLFEDHQAKIAELTKRLEAAELNAAREKEFVG